MALARLIADLAAPITAIAAHLDTLGHDARVAALDGLGRAQQRALYEKAAAAAPLTLDDLVGAAGPLTEVIHRGRNTLPLPAPLRRFEKRMCRPADGSARLFGYNEGLTRRPVGPGYFVAYATAGRPAWQARGALVIDYHQVPDGAVVASWPRVVPNDWRLQRFVYGGTRDFLRRVAAGVTIGAAFRGEAPLDHYFTLARASDAA
jgi:hypothetical protein